MGRTRPRAVAALAPMGCLGIDPSTGRETTWHEPRRSDLVGACCNQARHCLVRRRPHRVKERASRSSKFLLVRRVVRTLGIASVLAAVACSCSAGSGSEATSRPGPSTTTIVKNLHATTRSVTATVDRSCYGVRPVRTTRTFRDSASALTFASSRLLPRWTDAPQPFESIGQRGATRFFMRSMSRADVVALDVSSGAWLIVGTGHC
jgi:hypothetical protein